MLFDRSTIAAFFPVEGRLLPGGCCFLSAARLVKYSSVRCSVRVVRGLPTVALYVAGSLTFVLEKNLPGPMGERLRSGPLPITPLALYAYVVPGHVVLSHRAE